MCSVRQSHGRHFVSLSSSTAQLTLLQGILCLACVSVCASMCVQSHLRSISCVFLMPCPAAEESGPDRAQTQRLSPPCRRAATVPPSHPPSASDSHSKNHTRAKAHLCLCMWTRSHCHRRRLSQQLIFMHLNPYPRGP